MVKIVTRKSLGRQNVYDIGVERDHNFLIKNGLIASNCFNKSHSTAYGYVTYQTAYLKANYRLEYMAALLTANSGDTDKVQKYIHACKTSMDIKIEPPDINRSGVDFTPSADKILFGLSAVRNVGQNAIACILAARKEQGFTSLADFCDRVDLGAVNRRTLESLIYCGAFDKINHNRNQLINDLALVYDWAQSRARDRATGQGNLFDLLGGGFSSNNNTIENSSYSAPKAKPVPDFILQEKLQKEKELLGFYVSDHPLKAISESARVLAPIPLSQIEQQKEETFVCAVVMLNNVKKVITKKGEPMAILQIEDFLATSSEAVVYTQTYECLQDLLLVDTRLLILGKINRHRDGKLQLVVEDVEPVETVQMVMVELNPQQAVNNEELRNLKTILQEQSGDKEKAKVPVIGIVRDGSARQLVRFGKDFWVQDSRTTVEALQSARFFAHVQQLTSI